MLLENLLRFYDDLSKQSADTDGVAIKSVVANRKVGDIRRRLGEFDKALTAYEQAIQRLEKLNGASIANPILRLEHARTHNGRGMVLKELRSFDDASQPSCV